MKKIFNNLLVAFLAFSLLLPLTVYSDYPETKIYTHKDYLIEYRVINSWDNAQNVNVTISNTGNNSITGWAVKYNASGEITGLWNGVIYKSENENYIIKNSGYNSEIKPNESITFGYTLSGEDLTVPEDIEICSHRSVKSSGFKVEMIETGNWGTGFQAEINISNLTEKSIEAWELSFDGNLAVEEIWNAKLLSEEENTYKTAGLEGNTAIQPYSSVKFGMRAEKEEDIQPVIENIVLSEMLIDDNLTLDSEEGRDEFDNEIYCKELSDETTIAQDGDSLPYVANQLLVMADDSISFKEMKSYAAEMNAEIVGYIGAINKYQLEFADVSGEKLRERIEKFKSNPLIKNVSHNYVFEFGEDSAPDDPQYALYNSENNINNSDWNLHAINVFRAWDYYDKMIPIKIGVVDSTFDENHDDLSFKKVWGKFRNMGYDFLGINGHGTHVAGIMAADFNDGVGISGICPKNELYGYAVGVRTDLNTLETGLSKLIENDIKVINVSRNNLQQSDDAFLEKLKNGREDNEAFLSWVESAKDLSLNIEGHLADGYDFLIVSSAGNKDINTVYNSWLNYIKDQRVKNHIITVISIKDDTSSYAASENMCYGSRIDVAAPGEDILSTVPNNSYSDEYHGTSMAAPHVSGIAGMMYSVNPDISGTEIKEIIKGTSKLRTVKDSHGYEYGIADARLAVSTAYYHQADNPDKIVFGKLEDKNDPSNKFANVKIAVSYDGQERSIYSDDNGEFEIVIPKETETGSLKYQVDGYAANAKVEAEYLRSTAVVNVDLAPVSITVKGKVSEHNKTTNITKPLVGYTVTAVSKDNPDYTAKGTTNALGEYEISLGNAGDYTVIFTDKLQYDFYADNGEYFFDAVIEAEDDDDGSGGDKEDGGNGENTGGGSENDPPKDWETEVTEENSIVISTEVDDPSKDNDNTKTGGDFGVDLKQGIYIDCGEYTCRVYVEDYEYSSSEIWTAYITNKLKYDIYKNGVLISSYFTYFWYKRVVSSINYTTWIYTEYVSSVGVKTVRENGRNNIYLTYTIKKVHNPVRGEPDSVFERNILMISGSDAVPTVRNH